MISLRYTHFSVLAAALACALLTACTPPPSTAPPGNLTLDLRRLQADFMHQEQAIAELGQRLATAEGQLAQHGTELEALRQQLDQPGAGAAPGEAAWFATGSQPGASTISAEIGDLSPTEIYLQAFGDYASGRYQQAIQGFQTFLQRFPNNSYASNAQFWLGDCYFNQQQYSMAIQAFQKGLDDYPRAQKNPDALLKIAMAHLQLGNTAEARQARETLTRRYPESTAAKKAAELALP